jgi:hypothetical protein
MFLTIGALVMIGVNAAAACVNLWARRNWQCAEAKALACIRRLEEPLIPPRYKTGLAQLAAAAAGASQLEREAGLQLADHLRKCFNLPDQVLAAIVVETVGTAASDAEAITGPETRDDGPLGALATIVGVAAAELTALDRELAG